MPFLRTLPIRTLGILLCLALLGGCERKELRFSSPVIRVAMGGSVTLPLQARGVPAGELVWAVNELEGGAVDPRGNYQAPARQGVFHVHVRSRHRASLNATVEIRVGPPERSVAAGTLLRGRNHPVLTLLGDGTVLVVGGDEAHPRIAERFDPATGRSVSVGELPFPWAFHPVRLQNGKVLLIALDKPSLLFDPDGNTLQELGALNHARSGFATCVLADGRVLIAGGEFYDSGPIGHPPSGILPAELFDPATGRFQVIGSLAEDRIAPSATLLPDGRVLVLGGKEARFDTGRVTGEIFDPQTLRFEPLGAQLRLGRYGHQALSLADGRILIVGGQIGSRGPSEFMELFSPAIQAFGEPLPGAADRAFLLADGSVFLLQGEGASRLDPARMALSRLPFQFGRKRTGWNIVALQNGQFLVMGGDGGNGQSPAPDVERLE